MRAYSNERKNARVFFVSAERRRGVTEHEKRPAGRVTERLRYRQVPHRQVPSGARYPSTVPGAVSTRYPVPWMGI